MSRTRSTDRRTAISAAAGGLGLTLVATAAFLGPAAASPRTPSTSDRHHSSPSASPSESESESESEGHHSSPSPSESESHHSTPSPTESESEHGTETPDPTPTETTADPTPTETTADPTPTDTTADPTPTETTPDPGTPTGAPTSTPDPTPSSSTSESPESLPFTGGRTTGLPQTGSSSALVALLGAGLLGLGGATMLVGRRRPVTEHDGADDAS